MYFYLRSRFEEGFNKIQIKNSAVKKFMTILASPTVEGHDNLETLMSEIGVDGLNFGSSADMKLVMLLCGKQIAASKYCCPFYFGCSPWIEACESTTDGYLKKC